MLKMENKEFKVSQYACAVLLIVSSIALVAYQMIKIDDFHSLISCEVNQALTYLCFYFFDICDDCCIFVPKT